jgi:hypothetical protein
MFRRLQRCHQAVDGFDLESSQSGFDWYRMSKLEHQLVNIRHSITRRSSPTGSARRRTSASSGSAAGESKRGDTHRVW